jgi:hypothetical protein
LPYGFAEGGVATGIAFILMIIFVASISMGWLVEVQGRACGLAKAREFLSLHPCFLLIHI